MKMGQLFLSLVKQNIYICSKVGHSYFKPIPQNDMKYFKKNRATIAPKAKFYLNM